MPGLLSFDDPVQRAGLSAGLLNAAAAIGQANQPGVQTGSLIGLGAGAFGQGRAQAMQLAQQQQAAQQRNQAMQAMVGGVRDPRMRALAAANPEMFSKVMLQNALAKPKERRIVQAADGFKYYADTGERVLPGVAAKPTSPKFKRAWDNAAGKMIFASDEQIAASGGNLSPVPSGMKMVSDGKGGFTLVTGDMAAASGAVTPLTSSSKAAQEDAYISAINTLSSLDNAMASYQPEFSTYEGQLKAWGLAMGEKLNVHDMSPEQREYVEGFTNTKRNILENLSATLSRLSGAAVSPSEARRIGGTQPTMEDSPTEFLTKMKSVREQMVLVAMRAFKYRADGITGEALAERMTLPQMKRLVNSRGNELAREVKAKHPGYDEAQIRQLVKVRLQQEFGRIQ